MWREFGFNFDEKNVVRIVGILELMENILIGIDKDCKLFDRLLFRGVKKKEEVVS